MKEVMDNTVTVIKNALSATPIDKDRLVVGTEDGLFCVDLERDGNKDISAEHRHKKLINFLASLQKFVELVTARRSIRWSTCRRSSSSSRWRGGSGR